MPAGSEAAAVILLVVLLGSIHKYKMCKGTYIGVYDKKAE